MAVSRRIRNTLFLGFLLSLTTACSNDNNNDLAGNSDPNWSTVWGRATFTLPEFPLIDLPPPEMTDETLRVIVRPTHGGQRLRLRFSNHYSPDPVHFNEVWVGKRDLDSSLIEGSNSQVTFNGEHSVTLTAGTVITSDPVDFDVQAFEDLAISIYVEQTSTIYDNQLMNKVTSYRSAGNQAANDNGALFEPNKLALAELMSRFSSPSLSNGDAADIGNDNAAWLYALDVYTAESTGTIVGLGDSIMAGTCNTVDDYNNFTDLLSRHLYEQRDSGGYKSVVNMGIGGNTASPTEVGVGESSLERLQREVLNLADVTHMMLWVGTNDLGNILFGDLQPASAETVIEALDTIRTTAQAKGIKVIAMTIIPRKWETLNLPLWPVSLDPVSSDEKRVAINDWMLNDAGFDAVIDASAVFIDPQTNATMLAEYDCDGIHPTVEAYEALFNSLDMSVFDDG